VKSGILEFWKSGKPAERAAVAADVREILATKPDEDYGPERRALRDENARRRAEMEAEQAAHAKESSEADEALARARRRVEDVAARRPSTEGYRTWRDTELWPRGRATKSPLADALKAKTRAEETALEPENFVVPADDLRPRMNPQSGTGVLMTDEYVADLRERGHRKTITTEPYVAARKAALRELVVAIDKWTERCEYADDAELSALYSKAYEALPAIPALANLVRQDPRGAKFVRPPASGPEPRPAA
jgi:hypothetical protein